MAGLVPLAASSRRSAGASARWHDVPPAAILFALMMDSGGELGMRTVAVGLLALLTWSRRRRLFVTHGELGAWAVVMAFMVPSVLIALFTEVPLSAIAIWTAPIVAFPLVLGAVRANHVTAKPFVDGGLVFAMVVVVLFFGRLNQIESINAVHDYLAERSAGFFNEKEVFFDEPLPVVYFQGILALVMCAMLAISQRRYVVFSIICTALIVAPSRFGTFLVLVCGALVLLFRFHRSAGFRIVAVPALALGVLGFLSLPETFVEIFSSGGDGSSTRLLHVSSVLDVLAESPHVLLFGQGPGSTFFSRGFGELTDNIEVSLLEALRKFGFPFAFTLTLLLGATCVRLVRRREFGLSLAIAAHFIVAFSNPVLFSLPATFLLAIAIATLNPLPSHAPHRRRRRQLQPVDPGA